MDSHELIHAIGSWISLGLYIEIIWGNAGICAKWKWEGAVPYQIFNLAQTTVCRQHHVMELRNLGVQVVNT